MTHATHAAHDDTAQQPTEPAANGLFVTFEGIDGAGKSTHIARLVEKFKSDGREVVVTREPGGTDLAEKLRTMFIHDQMSPLCETLLVFAGRENHIEQVIAPALARGAVVVCDRFTDSSWAYQGGGRKFDHEVLRQLENWVQKGLQPDLTFWFDLPPQVAAQRLASARDADRFEALDAKFFVDVRAGYYQRAQAYPERFIRIKADQPVESVWLDVEAALAEKLPELGCDGIQKPRAPRP